MRRYVPKRILIQVEVDPHTGKRKCDPITGELCIMEWPRTGLCPFCLPNVTVDGRIAKRRAGQL